MKKAKTSVQDVRKDASSIASPDRVQNIPCIMIDEAPDNEGIPMTNLEDLAQSIRQYGQLTPVGVYLKEDGRYELYSGHRRLRAVRDILKQDNIRCIVEPYENDPEKRFGKHLDANLQTRDKDVRFWIAEIGNALALVRQRETHRPSRTEDMDLVSELFKEHGLTKGFSRPSLYRIYQLKEMAPALLDTCQYGVRAATLYQAIGLTKEEQEELARRIGESMEKMSERDDPDQEPVYPSAQFKREVEELKAGRERQTVSRGRKKKTYAENLANAQEAYLKLLKGASTQEEKETARSMAADAQKEIDQIFLEGG